MTFEDAKKALLEKKQIFEDIGEAYKSDSYKRNEFFKASDDCNDALDDYEKTLPQLSKEEYDKEYTEALQYDEYSSIENAPFIPTEPTQSGQNVPATPLNPFTVAGQRRKLAQKWVDIMSRNIH